MFPQVVDWPFSIYLCPFTVYASVVACCLAIPALTVTPATAKFTTLMACFGIELVPLLTFIVGLHFKDNQKVQHWLHPLQELVDGFPKSSSTLPMKELHQVIVTTNTTDPAAATTEQTTTNEAINNPKPSQVFKTWPKGPPFPVKALYSFKTTAESELAFRRGDQLMVLDCRGRWWHAEKDDAQRGFIPSNYVQVLLKAEVVVEYAGEAEDELAVAVGSVVEVMERYEEKCLIRTGDGKIGAIPTACLKFSEDEKKDANSIGKENTNDDKENANINVNK